MATCSTSVPCPPWPRSWTSGRRCSCATAITNGITVRQQLTPDDRQGRVNTTGHMIAWGGTPFGALQGGLTAEAYGISAAYLVPTR